MRILIDDGEVFDGTEEMLLDCFGVYIDGLDSFCEFHGFTYEIRRRGEARLKLVEN